MSEASNSTKYWRISAVKKRVSYLYKAAEHVEKMREHASVLFQM